VNGSSDLQFDLDDVRERMANTLLLPGASDLFFNFSVDGEDLAGQSAYIRRMGNWFHSFHIGVLAHQLSEDIAVYDIHELSILLYGKQGKWRVLQTAQLQELMRSHHPPILITLDARRQGREHFSSTSDIHAWPCIILAIPPLA
jgi:hypothetical protein